ncbi:MAG TPA: phage baseplate assembly protein V [Kofleriaceae bacterium]|jgi:uncharacterized protein involved in type VI secretion and phage assembly|nr:phage baseplate assembly protein V [Kofleriaceae bacterium]
MRQVDPKSFVEREGPPRWYGVYPAKVTSVKDPDSQGRIQVQLMGSPDEGGESFKVWARVATLMAGPSRGSFFIPDPDDEVLVAFFAGDPRRPYVVGALWNGQDSPPESMDGGGNNNIRVIKSRAGHKLEFDDTDGSAKITLTTPNGNKLVLDDGATKLTLEGSAGAKIEFDSSGGITITAPSGLTVQTPQMTVNAPMATFSGVTTHQTMISTTVVGSTYTPGAGNLW